MGCCWTFVSTGQNGNTQCSCLHEIMRRPAIEQLANTIVDILSVSLGKVRSEDFSDTEERRRMPFDCDLPSCLVFQSI